MFRPRHDEGVPTFPAPRRLHHLDFVIEVLATRTRPLVAAGDQDNRFGNFLRVSGGHFLPLCGFSKGQLLAQAPSDPVSPSKPSR